MVQGSDRLGFELEPLLEIRIRRHMFGQHLDGDGAVEADVGGLVDLATADFDLIPRFGEQANSSFFQTAFWNTQLQNVTADYFLPASVEVGVTFYRLYLDRTLCLRPS